MNTNMSILKIDAILFNNFNNLYMFMKINKYMSFINIPHWLI